MKPQFLFALVCAMPLAALASTHVSVGLTIGRPAPIIIHRAPPVRMSEVRSLTPGPGYVWVDGHYSWSSGQWVWLPGTWVVPPQPNALWVAGLWDANSQSWTEGHWEIAQPTSPPPPPVMTPAPVSVALAITIPPPPPRREHRPRPPGHGLVWVTGYWTFQHGSYVWAPGHWIRPPRGHGRWVAPRWEHRGGTYVFIEGTWR